MAGDTSRVTNLAAIADSLDYLADMLQAAIIEQGDESSLWAEKSVTLSNKQRSVEIGQVPVIRNHAAMLDGLDDLVDRWVLLDAAPLVQAQDVFGELMQEEMQLNMLFRSTLYGPHGGVHVSRKHR